MRTVFHRQIIEHLLSNRGQKATALATFPFPFDFSHLGTRWELKRGNNEQSTTERFFRERLYESTLEYCALYEHLRIALRNERQK